MALFCMSHLAHRGLQNWKGYQRDLDTVMDADPLLRYAYHAWAIHARNSLDDASTTAKVAEFVQGCQSFPATGFYIGFDLLGPLHVVSFFNLPISLAGSDLKNTIRLNSRTPNAKNAPLHLVCHHTSNLGTLEKFLALRFINVNAANTWKETPLIRVRRRGQIHAAELLLAHPKIRLDAKDQGGLTAFIWAARYANEALVNAILVHSPAQIGVTDKWGRTALSWVCEHGHFAMVEVLPSHSKSEVHVADIDGRTPLIWASMSHCIRTLKLILSYTSDGPHLADRDGRTPMSWAASRGDWGVITTLLALPGTNVNEADKQGRTPLRWA